MAEQDQDTDQKLCVYCEKPFDAQGIFMHVRNTEGNGHGERGETPDEFDPRTAPLVTEDDEEIQAPLNEAAGDDGIDYQQANKLFLCNYCGQFQKGKRGYSIHASKSSGDELHPEDLSVAQGDYTVIPADNNWNALMDPSDVAKVRAREVEDVEEDVEEDQGEIMETEETRAAALEEAELQARIMSIVVPDDATKKEQVAAVLTQEPALYDRPEEVRDLVNCSRTTFYEGRSLYDHGYESEEEELERREGADDTTEQEFDAVEIEEDQEHPGIQSIEVNGIQMIPVHELENLRVEVEEVLEMIERRIDKYERIELEA